MKVQTVLDTFVFPGVTLDWDDAGRVQATHVGSSATAGIEGDNEYGYLDGKKIWRKITRGGSVVTNEVYIYAGPNRIAEYSASQPATNPLRQRVFADGIDSLSAIVQSNGEVLIPTRNRQWSIVALTDNSTGSVLERYSYDQFGERTIYAANGTTTRTTSTYANNYGYTSREHLPESGLMYFRARYYDTTTGEFISRDPLEYVDGMSLYRGYFVPGAVDPTGRRKIRCGCYSSWWRKNFVTVDCNGLASTCCKNACDNWSGEWYVADASDDPGEGTQTVTAQEILQGILSHVTLRAGIRQSIRICGRIGLTPICVCAILSGEIEARGCNCPKPKVCNINRVSVEVGLYACESLGGRGFLVPTLPGFQVAQMPAAVRKKKGGGVGVKRPISGIGGIGSTQCPKEGLSGSACVTGSVGFSSNTIGGRACYDFGSESWSSDAGYGIGYGTGISGSGSATFTTCF